MREQPTACECPRDMISAALLFTAFLIICAPGPHDNCVMDGDTFRLAGEKIRISDGGFSPGWTMATQSSLGRSLLLKRTALPVLGPADR